MRSRSNLCRGCGEPLRLTFPCLVCEYEATIGRRLDRSAASWLPVAKREQLPMFEVPKAKRPSAKDLYQAERHHDDAA